MPVGEKSEAQVTAEQVVVTGVGSSGQGLSLVGKQTLVDAAHVIQFSEDSGISQEATMWAAITIKTYGQDEK